MTDDLLQDSAEALLEPLFRALDAGEVRMFTSLESELCGSQASSAVVSDRANRRLFPVEELDAVDQVLPWTCSVVSGPVVLEDGAGGSLLEYAVAHQHELILKPTVLHGGEGVVPGWSSDLTGGLAHAAARRAGRSVGAAAADPSHWGVVMPACGYGELITVAPRWTAASRCSTRTAGRASGPGSTSVRGRSGSRG
ncbi:hypothetical protein [Streptomyces griseoluteus]|uniref:hypothetical protein n=1 Tax=Streptomyces griseoluteus TaxID=29306 RepID=UPI0036F63C4A